MKSRIVRIGNSNGIRIPKPILDETGLCGEVEITAEKNTVIIRPVTRPRANWAAAFREMAQQGDDRLLAADQPSLNAWDEGEWEWR